jgi:hypothetical protein
MSDSAPRVGVEIEVSIVERVAVNKWMRGGRGQSRYEGITYRVVC